MLVLNAFGFDMSRAQIYRTLTSIDNDRWKKARAQRGFGKLLPDTSQKY